MSKLIILGPDQEDPGRVFLETFAVSAVILVVMLVAVIPYVFINQETKVVELEPGEASLARVQNLMKQRIQILNKKHTWSFEEVESVFEHGPKVLSEKACTYVYEDKKKLRKPMTPKQRERLQFMSILMLKKHVGWAPHACLLRAHINRKLTGEGDLEVVGEYLWKDFKSMELSAKDTLWMLKEYRTTFNRPDHPKFYEWLRECGLKFGTQIWSECIQFLAQISPSQGTDFVDMLEKHLIFKPINKKEDVELVTSLYGKIIRRGYPMQWKPMRLHRYPNYDRDARIVSALQLCRMLNSPDAYMVEMAADALSDGAKINAREQTEITRWRLTCRGVFTNYEIKPPKPEDPNATPKTRSINMTQTFIEAAVNAGQTEADKKADPKADATPQIKANAENAILAVWTGSKDDFPDYTLTSVIKAGLCAPGLKPAWKCVADRYWNYTDSVEDVLQNAFVKTRFVEMGDLWRTPSKIELARPEKTLPRKMMNRDEFINNTPDKPKQMVPSPKETSEKGAKNSSKDKTEKTNQAVTKGATKQITKPEAKSPDTKLPNKGALKKRP